MFAARTRRTRPFPVSAMKRLPCASTATSIGCERVASAASPPSPLKLSVPVPTVAIFTNDAWDRAARKQSVIKKKTVGRAMLGGVWNWVRDTVASRCPLWRRRASGNHACVFDHLLSREHTARVSSHTRARRPQHLTMCTVCPSRSLQMIGERRFIYNRTVLCACVYGCVCYPYHIHSRRVNWEVARSLLPKIKPETKGTIFKNRLLGSASTAGSTRRPPCTHPRLTH